MEARRQAEKRRRRHGRRRRRKRPTKAAKAAEVQRYRTQHKSAAEGKRSGKAGTRRAFGE